MSDSIHKMSDSADGDRRFERLVDGALSTNEYRDLLAALDDEPGGWRRCALSFLEAQALGSELGAIRGSAEPRAIGAETPESLSRRRSKWGDVQSLLAIAASFLLAFALGVFAPQFFSSGRQEGPLAGNFRTGPLADDAALGGASADPVPRHVGNLTLVIDGAAGETAQTRQVPVYEVGPGLDEFLSADAPGLAPELIELLRHRGYNVQHEQQYFPAPLNDGRQIIVPVDGYRITPVGRRY